MKKIINSPNAPDPVGPYNQAILAGETLYISGQIAIDPKTGNLMTSDIESETRQVLNNIRSILKAAGMDMTHLVKCSLFVSDMGNYERINRVYSEYFDEKTAPARELVEVSKLPKYVNIEISGIAIR